ncbi:MAG TPA: DUF2934 domain-containing protein [Thermodesulfobacteriota bacterium]|nr:DUF2934 domain-containing protein [Thermodesulfobacteriota bacterium]
MAKEKVSSQKKPRRKMELDERTLQEMIAKKAHELYEKRGGGHGSDLDDWLEAERIVMGKKRKK